MRKTEMRLSHSAIGRRDATQSARIRDSHLTCLPARPRLGPSLHPLTRCTPTEHSDSIHFELGVSGPLHESHESQRHVPTTGTSSGAAYLARFKPVFCVWYENSTIAIAVFACDGAPLCGSSLVCCPSWRCRHARREDTSRHHQSYGTDILRDVHADVSVSSDCRVLHEDRPTSIRRERRLHDQPRD